MLKNVFGFFLLMFLLGCSEGEKVTADTAILGQDGTPQLLFFLDPNGGPCMMQGRILAGMADELRGRVGIREIRTTLPEDRPLFGQFGIRGLPSLILVDGGGKEIRRLTPGVKNVEEIRFLLNELK
ncbi:thioredoxin family protein [Trichloromonas sp.]|uniref:thioredoxin family protein n=1 Tax=Trichloromonas sp. TaxID=3069249 RepID=UPI002A4E0827|nr:thioredoxin family protein [Trichloromonas sp.]